MLLLPSEIGEEMIFYISAKKKNIHMGKKLPLVPLFFAHMNHPPGEGAMAIDLQGFSI